MGEAEPTPSDYAAAEEVLARSDKRDERIRPFQREILADVHASWGPYKFPPSIRSPRSQKSRGRT